MYILAKHTLRLPIDKYQVWFIKKTERETLEKIFNSYYRPDRCRSFCKYLINDK